MEPPPLPHIRMRGFISLLLLLVILSCCSRTRGEDLSFTDSSSAAAADRPLEDQVKSVSAISQVHRKLVQQEVLNGTSGRRSSGAFVLLGGSVTLFACVFLCPCLQSKRKDEPPVQQQQTDSSSHHSASGQDGTKSLSSLHSSLSVTAGPGALTFTMAELNRITGSFSSSNKIGGGASGNIYKGKLRDGTLVAVKRAKKDVFDARHTIEFQNEVNMLSNIDHLNLVKLVGYLEDERERIIVVEFVPNGNLRQHLDGEYTVPDFSTRLDIAIDVAHALTYLHVYADQPIIHRDVKTANILLTDTCRAKVADFGFSRAGPSDIGATHVSTQVKGTAGYLDPEYLQTYQLTPKSDVYSFGILLIEIFSGRRPIELSRPSDERITVRWAFKKFVEGKVEDILDPMLPKNSTVVSSLERLAEVAFKCAAPSKRDRPSMKEAGETLWNIRREFQSSLSQSTTPSIDLRPSPLHSPGLHSPLHSPLHTSLDRSPHYKQQKALG